MSHVQGEDAPLSYHWRAPEDAVRRLSMPIAKTRDSRAAHASLLAAALIEHDGQGRYISYSRSSDLWASGIFEGTTYSKRTVVPFIDKLEELCWAEHDQAPPQPLGLILDEDLTKRWQSRFRATDRMADQLRGMTLDYRGPSSPIILRDADGSMLPLPKTDRVHRLRVGVDAVNAGLAGARLTVSPDADPANWRHSAYHLRARKVRADGSETWACTLPTPVPQVVRVYSRSSFDLHGRYYGWWQGLPKARRAELLINGEVLVEPDFKWLHPTLLYALSGHAIAHDPYTTGYWPRQAGKLAFNTFVNAPTTASAIGGLLKKRHEKGDDGEPVWKYGYRQTARILDAIRAANPAIAHMFGSDAGVRLMAIDSEMAGKVMKACRKASIPCLPVHDSFMVPASQGTVVEGIMGAVLDETLAAVKSKVSMTSAETYRHNAPFSCGGPRPEAVGAPLENSASGTVETSSPVSENPAREPVETHPPLSEDLTGMVVGARGCPSLDLAGPASAGPGSVSLNLTGPALDAPGSASLNPCRETLPAPFSRTCVPIHVSLPAPSKPTPWPFWAYSEDPGATPSEAVTMNPIRYALPLFEDCPDVSASDLPAPPLKIAPDLRGPEYDLPWTPPVRTLKIARPLFEDEATVLCQGAPSRTLNKPEPGRSHHEC